MYLKDGRHRWVHVMYPCCESPQRRNLCWAPQVLAELLKVPDVMDVLEHAMTNTAADRNPDKILECGLHAVHLLLEWLQRRSVLPWRGRVLPVEGRSAHVMPP